MGGYLAQSYFFVAINVQRGVQSGHLVTAQLLDLLEEGCKLRRAHPVGVAALQRCKERMQIHILRDQELNYDLLGVCRLCILSKGKTAALSFKGKQVLEEKLVIDLVLAEPLGHHLFSHAFKVSCECFENFGSLIPTGGLPSRPQIFFELTSQL